MGKRAFAKILSAALLAALLLSTVLFQPRAQKVSGTLPGTAFLQTVIIDAGHGGEDGGAVGASGVPESGINLAIARKLDDLLALYGVPTKLLRETEQSIHSGDAITLRQQKVSDLHNRVDLIAQTPNGLVISIHQNKFGNPKYHGAQVFYANNAQPFAAYTQMLLRAVLDPENSRVATKIPSSVYLMSHITCPAILVECGFLSNPAEDYLLQTDGYQTKIAATLAASYLQFDGLSEGELEHEG
ncbi:MAG: N-acetylmuramoyl-L-alanine amidase [Pseudoflavonifractor sp.]